MGLSGPTSKKKGYSKEDYDVLVDGFRDLANQMKKEINEKTLIVYIDKGGRIVRLPLEKALKEKGVKLPEKRFFFDFSFKSLSRFKAHKLEGNIYDREEAEKFQKELSEKLKGKNFENVVIIDEYVDQGRTLKIMEKTFKEVTGKDVVTVSLAVSPSHKRIFTPDYYVKNKKFEQTIVNLAENIVPYWKPKIKRVNTSRYARKLEQEEVWIESNPTYLQKFARNKEGKVVKNPEKLKLYNEYLEHMKKAFKKHRRR